MPCGAAARGIRQSAPHTGMAFNDAINNNPCGKGIVTLANGVNTSAHSLCLPHLKAKLGQAAVEAPYTFAA